MGAPPIRLAIIEDDQTLLAALVQRLSRTPEFVVCGTTSTVQGGLELVRAAEPPDVLLIDLALADGSGLQLIQHVQANALPCKTLVISVFADVGNVVRAIELGADGYLLKGADLEETVTAIRTVVAGGSPLSPAVASHILRKLRGSPSAKPGREPPVLTSREVDILESLSKGLTFKEVANAHGISPYTVGDHVKAIYKKLSVNSRGEAVFEALQSGLLRMGP